MTLVSRVKKVEDSWREVRAGRILYICDGKCESCSIEPERRACSIPEGRRRAPLLIMDD